MPPGKSPALGHNLSFRGDLIPRTGPRRAVQWSAKAALVHQDDSDAAILVLGHDITELQAAQRQALQSERLAAVGQVTATLAHESRNLLQRSQACLERLSWRLGENPEALRLVQNARQAERELTRLFEDLQSSTSSLQLEWTPCDLQEIWRDIWREVCNAFAYKQTQLGEAVEGSLLCLVDRFRLGQVFRNLFRNAFAACDPKVEIEVHAQPLREGSEPIVFACARSAIMVRDSNAEQRQKVIFEPFYTTKPRRPRA